MAREGQRPEELTYDFERDVWVADAFVESTWRERELPSPVESPSPGAWHRAEPSSPWRSWGTRLGRLPTMSRRGLVGAFGLFFLSAFVSAPLLMAVGFVLLLCGMSFSLPNGLWASERDLTLLEDPRDQDVCLVEVTIFNGSATVGIDRGVAWFDGGRLLYSGHRTSFAIGGEDVLPRSAWSNEVSTTPLVLPLRTRWEGPVLRFAVLNYGNPEDRHETRFLERFHAFRTRPPQSRGQRQWPPF